MLDQRKSKSFVDVMLTPLRVFDQRKSKSFANIMLTPLHSMFNHKTTRGATSEQPSHLPPRIFDVFLGYWTKASKCKKLLRRVQHRLKLLKDKRCSILQQSRFDAQLLRCGGQKIAETRVAQIYKDECMLEVYDLLDAFCEVIILNLPYIRKQRDCPVDINEAASTLVFASARCGELPELRKLRNLFGERYGQEFNTTALDLLPGNLVNWTVKENLTRRSVPNDAKKRILDEISYSFQVKPLPLEYTPEWQKQHEMPHNHSLASLQDGLRNDSKIIPENGIPVRHSGYEESDVHASKVSKNEGNEEGNKSVPNDAKNRILKEISNSLQVEPLPLDYTPEWQKQHEMPDNHSLTSLQDGLKSDNKIIPENGIPVRHSGYEESDVHASKLSKNEGIEEGGNKSSSAPNYPQKPFPIESYKEVGLFKNSTSEETVYLDDIEEVHYSICKDGDSIQDQSIFYFKLSNIPTKKKSSYLRATSMPSERPKNDQSDSILRSSSFPFEHSTNHWSNAPRSPHVHPKLPEYDDIAEQFKALKEAALQKKRMEGRSNSFTFKHSTNHWNNAPHSPQVHPKLPEYDAVAVH